MVFIQENTSENVIYDLENGGPFVSWVSASMV